MIIDFHTHTFPDKIAEKTIGQLQKSAVTKAVTDGTAQGLLEHMRKSRVSHAVTLPVVTANRQFATVNRVAAEINEENRKKEVAISDESQPTLTAFGGIHPEAAGTKENPSGEYIEQLRIISEYGLKGIKIHPDYQETFIDDIRYLRILDRARELGLWTVTHAGYDPISPDCVHCSPQRVAKVLQDVPGDRIILAHMGNMTGTEEVMNYLAGKEIWMDTAITMTMLVGRNSGAEDFVKLVHCHGSDKILFATDCPWEGMEYAVREFLNLPLTKEEQDAILYKNALRILEA